jgi:dethiobiotin synthetase/adenosylmethionine--8-amino-7-oxononanoate aminotransferase
MDNAKVPLYAGWATRAYFSDNGSTAIEIALKMAFRKFSFDHGILSEDNAAGRSVELMVGLTNPFLLDY